MKRVSTIQLITELSKYGKLTLEKSPRERGDNSPRYFCRYEPQSEYMHSDTVQQRTDDILSFMRIAAGSFTPGVSKIFDHITDQFI